MGIYEDCMNMDEKEFKSVLKQIGIRRDVKDSKEAREMLCSIVEAIYEQGPREAAHATVIMRKISKAFL